MKVLRYIHSTSGRNRIELWSGDLDGFLHIWKFVRIDERSKKRRLHHVRTLHAKYFDFAAIMTIEQVSSRFAWIGTRTGSILQINIERRMICKKMVGSQEGVYLANLVAFEGNNTNRTETKNVFSYAYDQKISVWH